MVTPTPERLSRGPPRGRGRRGGVPPGQTLSDAALAEGVDLPISCEEGYCGTCLCHLYEGEMSMAIDDALTGGQKKRGMLLACQATPRSEKARVVFQD